MRPSPAWITPLGLVCVSVLSCVNGTPTGPGDVGSAQLSLQPLPAPAGPGGVAIAGVRVSLERIADGSTAVDTTVVFPADADSLMLDLTVPLGSFVEQFTLTLLALDADGLDVFVGGPTPLVLTSGAPATIAPLLAYVGPGADAASVRALNADTALFYGESITVDAEAIDATGTPIGGTPVLWRSLDGLVAGFPDVSTPVVQAGQQRGLARIVASLYTGPADTVLVRAQPLPTSVAVVSGDAQIGAVGGALPDPLVARVTAADGLGVEGVWVRFVVTSGDGQLTADSVRSDASGDAAVDYQLGSAGTHTVEASVAGVAATATFTATAAASGEVYWTNGAGGNWSDGANWSTGSAPTASNTAYVTLDGTYTVTLDADAAAGGLVLGGGSGTQTLVGSAVALTLGGAASVQPNGVLDMSGGSIAGNGALTNQGASTTLLNVSVSVPVANEGMLRLRGTTTLSGGYTTTVFAETRVEALGGATGAIGFTTGWTNLGLLVMSHGGNGGGQAVTLTVAGTLVNETNATLIVEPGIGGGGRVLSTELDNRGTFDAQTAVTIDAIAAVHANSGTFRASGGNVTISQSDGSFVSTGTITVDASRTLSLIGGAWSTGGSTVDGSGTISLDNTSWDVGPGHVITSLTYTIRGGTIFGNGTLTNQGPGTTLLDVDVFVPIDNEGLLRLRGATTLGSRYTTTASAETRVEALGVANAAVQFTSGWTNLGLLVMSHGGGGGGQSATLSVAGTLVNEAQAEIVAEPGIGGGARVLTTQLDNLGMLDAQTALTINGVGAAHANSGTFQITGGDVVISQSGTTPQGAPPSFTSTGVVLVGTGRVLAVSGGTFWNTASGGLEGDGTIDVTGTLFTSEGVIVPGLPTGILTLAGDYVPTQTSVLEIELGGRVDGTDYDRLAVTVDVDLQGALNVKLVNGFVPQQGDRFVIMTFGGGGGIFDTVNLPLLGPGLFWNVVYGQNDVTLEVLLG